MTITRVGVHIAKSVFHVHGLDRRDHALWTGKLAMNGWMFYPCGCLLELKSALRPVRPPTTGRDGSRPVGIM